MTTGQRIRSERKLKGLTQEALGQKLGVSGAAIAQYETGRRKPKMDTLRRIAKALDIDVNKLSQSLLDIEENDPEYVRIRNELLKRHGLINDDPLPGQYIVAPTEDEDNSKPWPSIRVAPGQEVKISEDAAAVAIAFDSAFDGDKEIVRLALGIESETMPRRARRQSRNTLPSSSTD